MSLLPGPASPTPATSWPRGGLPPGLAVVVLVTVLAAVAGFARAQAPARSGSAGRPDAAMHGIPAHAYEVLAEIERRGGQAPPGYVGGRTFGNRERRLPRGVYREYDVFPYVPGRNRGVERLVIEQRTGRAYYTADHYRTFVLVPRDQPPGSPAGTKESP